MVRTGPSVSTLRCGCVMDAGYPRVTLSGCGRQAATDAGAGAGTTTRRTPHPETEAGCTSSTRKTRAQSRHDHAAVGSGNGVTSSPEQNGQVRWWSVGMTSSVARHHRRYNNRPLSEPKRLLMYAVPPAHCPRAPIARATTSSDVSRAAVASRPMSVLARAVRGIVSVGLKALEFVSDT